MLWGVKRSVAPVPEVVAERRLAVRARGEQAPAAAARQRPAAQEPGDGIAPAVPRGHRRHGDQSRPRSASRRPRRRRHAPMRRHSRARCPGARRRRACAASPAGSARAAAHPRPCGRAGARCRPTPASSRAHAATSAPEKPSTSQRISAARWRGGSCWSAAMNASSTALALLVAGPRGAVPGSQPSLASGLRLDPHRFDERLRRDARRGRRRARSRPEAAASAVARSTSDRCWWRSGRARIGASFGPRTRAARARRRGSDSWSASSASETEPSIR